MRRLGWCLLLTVLFAAGAQAQVLGPGGTLPAVANLPGDSGTFWRTDVNIVNPNEVGTSVVLQLLPELTGPTGTPEFETILSDPVAIAPNSQLTLTNVVQSKFGLVNVKGSLMIYTTNGAPVALSARTYTVDTQGKSYGHDVSGVLAQGSAWVGGLAEDALYRTSIGIFWPWEEVGVFDVSVYHSDGTLAGSGPVIFPRSGLQQAFVTRFGVSNLIDGYAVITCTDPLAMWFAYGSRVDEVSGDAVFRPARSKVFEIN